MSRLTFNISVKDKGFIKTCTEPFQILPVRTGFVNYSSYQTNNPIKRNILIHTGYDFNLWKHFEMFEFSKQYMQIVNYMRLSHNLGADSILIHGPSSYNECGFSENLSNLLTRVNEINTVKSFCVEIPRFTHDLINTIQQNKTNMLDFIDAYTNKIIRQNCNIVFDTAHLYANGLTVDDMILLLTKYNDHYKYIHLNGNSNPKYSKDNHTIMINCEEEGRKPNLIGSPEEIDRLLYKVASLNKICVSEEKHTNYKYYQSLAKKYGFNLVSEKLCSLSV